MPLQPSGVPSRAGIQAAIDEAVAAAVAAIEERRQFGTEIISFASAASHVQTITFPVAMAEAPKIVTAVISSPAADAGLWSVRTDTYTTTSFRLILNRSTAAVWTNVPVNWEAAY